MPPGGGYDPIGTVQQAITMILTAREPEFIGIGTRMFMAFATIILAWHGIRMMLTWREPGEQMFSFAKLLLVIAFFVAVYGPTMERERANVSGRFPEAYAEWERNVPAFVPRPVPWRGGDEGGTQPFSFALYMRHREWQAGLVFVLVMLWFAVLRPRFLP